ncbi:MotA/TolQ/ExbB proton channel family protein [Caldichromatium japonicum]|uniref:MotA/TolQ/ExbB proton channel family protein n=1 Tax=Caldichromatium japonicum TaxID=2699430 RepID=A0A6G7VCZ7_9GAMM|nr:MotA/TolQ/ExbB proton channel family protein [Caldichromatium japonicum]QIK37844.1 MotA/TolQ/ExbB proton channel family protein [Caldichromatium japonicum]
MLELIYAGGWVMAPILACSILATAIVIERAWTLRRSRLMPSGLIEEIWRLDQQGRLTETAILDIRDGSALGRILAAGLINRRHAREVMKEAIDDAGRHVVAELERFLNTLGTIAAIAPLLGLLGTVLGMIDIFGVIMQAGVGNAAVLAGGISKALITTAAGLSVGIPALMFHRFFEGHVNRLALEMEEEALRLIEILQSGRELSTEVDA